MAVIECDPTDSVEVEKVAWPEMRLLVTSAMAPSLKITVPVGVPDPGATVLTVAVKVTDCPEHDGLADELRAVVVPALLTDCVKLVDVLVLKLPSPLNTALMMWLETVSDEIANVA